MFVLSTKSFMDKNMFLQWVGIFFSLCVFKAGWIERDKSYIQRTCKGARRGDSCPQESHQFHSAGQLLDKLSLLSWKAFEQVLLTLPYCTKGSGFIQPLITLQSSPAGEPIRATRSLAHSAEYLIGGAHIPLHEGLWTIRFFNIDGYVKLRNESVCLYEQINFKWNKRNKIFGKTITIEYDLDCNANICSTHYEDGEKQSSLHPSTTRKETEKGKKWVVKKWEWAIGCPQGVDVKEVAKAFGQLMERIWFSLLL